VVLFVVVIGGLGFYSVRSLKNAVARYTTDRASAVVAGAIEPAMLDTAAAHYSEVVQAFTTGRAYTTEFSESELRALIYRTPWRERVFPSLTGDELAVKFAFPLGAVGDWTAASAIVKDITSRVVAGSAQGKLTIKDGVVSLSLSKLELNGHVLEEMARGHASEWLAGAINALLAEQLGGSDNSRLKRIRSAAVVNGLLRVELTE
jgi:hypothetical protein